MSHALALDLVTLLAGLIVAGMGALCLLAYRDWRAERQYRREYRRGLSKWVGRYE